MTGMQGDIFHTTEENQNTVYKHGMDLKSQNLTMPE